MKIHLISGFLGSGKTTAIHHASRALIQRGIKTGVVTNDQGIRLVDGDFFKSLGIPGRQVVNGCFCCNYQHLADAIDSLSGESGTEIIFAESVGSCTDIVATVLKPLLQFYPGTPVTVTVFADVRLLQILLNEDSNPFDETVNYIFLKQLEEAGIIVINKVDLVSQEQLVELREQMQESYGSKVLLYQNSLDATDIRRWLKTLDEYRFSPMPRSLDLDYDRYARGEARLGWLDQELEIFSAGNNALQQAEHLVNTFYQLINEQRYPIGHVKFLINGSQKISFTSNDQPPVVLQNGPAVSAALLVNARVQTEPGILVRLLASAVEAIEIQSGCKIMVHSHSAFKPGYPRPVFRM